ncbi:MAG: GTP-binding protein [Lachnospiraceae bacterium]|nr:GTP-binding protein [Lachnospiraceae bacterium]
MENNRIVVGVLAHVDAGKTTLAESILYTSGIIRKLGRVDHKDAYLDTDEQEKDRGITIFSKQAVFNLENKEVMLLDTPGHIDFSAEMERTLKVLDYAILVVNGVDRIEGHIKTLWKLLENYSVPTFIFINKMDQDLADKEWIANQIREKFDSNCVDFTCIGSDEWLENVAMCDEGLMEKYLEGEEISREDIIKCIYERRMYPCFYGSALKIEGIEEFLKGLETYTICKEYGEEFSAKVYKISRDSSGNRLTHMKITGGKLSVKQVINDEKVNQIYIYSGAKYNTVNGLEAGAICAVSGLSSTYVGQGLGNECDENEVYIEPVLSYTINLPKECDVHKTYIDLCVLQEEDPQLHIKWNEKLNEIHAMVMGEVQIEVLQNIIKDRFNIEVTFSEGSIVYKETIDNVVEGVGHYEPLRHYSEVHLLMEPGERGSGIAIDTECSEDVLDKNWQRLILTHLKEKQHVGVLTGSEITDIKITLVAGKAHLKHTEGGDFRQSTYRAVRQGLRQAKSILLEPIYEYRLEVPTDMVGRAMSDIGLMNGTFKGPDIEGDMSVITGVAPVSKMQGYSREVISYTRGLGNIYYEFKGYEPCHNQEEIIEQINYNPESDLDNPTGSVFCAHGAGFNVSWDEVFDYMHIESYLLKKEKKQAIAEEAECSNFSVNYTRGEEYNKHKQESMELHEIFTRTYGEIKRYKEPDSVSYNKGSNAEKPYKYKPENKKEEYLLVDGYNIIFAWEELKELGDINLEAARNKLMDILCNYQGFVKNTVILVFDAYKVDGNQGEIFKYHNIYVVYTKEKETADAYIEKTVREISKKYNVRVATSDILEQVIITGGGAMKISAGEFKKEIESVDINIRENHLNRGNSRKNYLFDNLPEESIKHLEDVRLGKVEF